jgi:hypothetical protein
MRRLLFAVCLLLLTPSPVMACYEDHKAGAGWFDEPSSRWSNYGIGAQAAQRDRLMDVSVFAGGSGVLILLGVCMRSFLRAAQRAADESRERVPLAMPNDSPPCEPLCVLAGLDSQDEVWAPVDFRDGCDESFTGVTLPVQTFCGLV